MPPKKLTNEQIVAISHEKDASMDKLLSQMKLKGILNISKNEPVENNTLNSFQKSRSIHKFKHRVGDLLVILKNSTSKKDISGIYNILNNIKEDYNIIKNTPTLQNEANNLMNMLITEINKDPILNKELMHLVTQDYNVQNIRNTQSKNDILATIDKSNNYSLNENLKELAKNLKGNTDIITKLIRNNGDFSLQQLRSVVNNNLKNIDETSTLNDNTNDDMHSFATAVSNTPATLNEERQTTQIYANDDTIKIPDSYQQPNAVTSNISAKPAAKTPVFNEDTVVTPPAQNYDKIETPKDFNSKNIVPAPSKVTFPSQPVNNDQELDELKIESPMTLKTETKELDELIIPPVQEPVQEESKEDNDTTAYHKNETSSAQSEPVQEPDNVNDTATTAHNVVSKEKDIENANPDISVSDERKQLNMIIKKIETQINAKKLLPHHKVMADMKSNLTSDLDEITEKSLTNDVTTIRQVLELYTTGKTEDAKKLIEDYRANLENIVTPEVIKEKQKELEEITLGSYVYDDTLKPIITDPDIAKLKPIILTSASDTKALKNSTSKQNEDKTVAFTQEYIRTEIFSKKINKDTMSVFDVYKDLNKTEQKALSKTVQELVNDVYKEHSNKKEAKIELLQTYGIVIYGNHPMLGAGNNKKKNKNF